MGKKLDVSCICKVKDILIHSGVPWILELVSSGIAAEHGFDETCWVRLGLDMSNLLAVNT